MKKFHIVLAVVLMLVLLCGCKPAEPQPYTPALADKLLESGAFEGSEMAPLDMDVVAMLYDIDPATIVEGVYYMAVNTSVSADEFLILVLTDEDAAIAAELACIARMQSQLAMCEDYCPAAVPRVKGAHIIRRGNTLLFTVGDPAILDSLDFMSR